MRTFLLVTSSDGLRTERDITYDRKAHKNKGIVSKAASNRLKAHKTRSHSFNGQRSQRC